MILVRWGRFWCGCTRKIPLRWFWTYRYVSSQNASSREWNMEPLEWFRLSGSHHKFVMLRPDRMGIKLYIILLFGLYITVFFEGAPHERVCALKADAIGCNSLDDKCPIGGIITSPKYLCFMWKIFCHVFGEVAFHLLPAAYGFVKGLPGCVSLTGILNLASCDRVDGDCWKIPSFSNSAKGYPGSQAFKTQGRHPLFLKKPHAPEFVF